MIENQTKITMEALIAMQKAFSRPMRWVRMVLVVLIGIYGMSQFLRLSGDGMDAVSFGILAIYLLLVLLLLLSSVLQTKRSCKAFQKKLAAYEKPAINYYQFQTDGFLAQYGGMEDRQEQFVPYHLVTQFLQDEKYYFLYVKSTNHVYIMKQDTFVPNDPIQVMAYLQEKLAKCKGIR